MAFCRSLSVYLSSGFKAETGVRAGVKVLEVAEIRVKVLLLLVKAHTASLFLPTEGGL